jgi:hypothetical protein
MPCILFMDPCAGGGATVVEGVGRAAVVAGAGIVMPGMPPMSMPDIDPLSADEVLVAGAGTVWDWAGSTSAQ